MGKIKAYVPRSRKGCLTCKKRHVKCDEVHPVCTRCLNLNLNCLYTKNVKLTWEDEAAERQITFGRSLKARAKKISLQKGTTPKIIDYNEELCLKNTPNMVAKRKRYIFVNNTLKDFRTEDQHSNKISSSVHNSLIKYPLVAERTSGIRESIFDLSTQLEFGDLALSKIFTSDDFKLDDIFLGEFALPVSSYDQYSSEMLCNLELNETESKLLTYFEKSIAPFCVCCDIKTESYTNPYLSLVVPLAYKSQIVMKSVAIAAGKQLVLLGHKEFEHTAEEYTKQVLDEFPKLMNNDKDCDNWDEVFATILMLCFVEISVSCNKSWLILLEDAKRVLKDACKHKTVSAVGKFFIRYFITHEVMGATAWSSPIDINDDPYIEELKQDYDTEIDFVLGCSPYLISLIHRVTVIGKCFEGLEIESDAKAISNSFMGHAKDTEKLLIDLKQHVSNNRLNSEESHNISTIAEIKRLAALLYLNARVYSEYERMNDIASIDYKDYKIRIRKLYATLPKCYMSLLWPIFVLGLVTEDDEEERWFVLNALMTMNQSRELQTVKTTFDVITSVWKEKDLDCHTIRWKDMVGSKASTISLA